MLKKSYNVDCKKGGVVINNIFIIDNLPKILTKEKSEELFIDFNNGSEIARDMLISSNIRLVISRVLTKFKNVQIAKNELVSVGNIGLIKAVDSYDISKEIDFSTYASRCIDNEIINYLKKYKNQIMHEIFNVSLYNSNGEDTEVTIVDNIANDVDIIKEYEQKETAILLNELVEKLEDKDKKIIKMYFGLGCERITQAEIAKILNIKRTTLTMRINSILKKMRKELEKLYGEERKIKVNSRKKTKLNTIYEFFDNYSREEINEVITNLNERGKQVLELRFGKNLDERNFSNLSIEDRNYFYKSLVPKIKKQLIINRINKKETKKQNSKDILIGESNNDLIKNIIILSNYFTDILTSKEIIVLLLKLGFIGNEEKSIKDISKSLNIEKDEVIEILKTSLRKIKKYINSNIDRVEKSNIK